MKEKRIQNKVLVLYLLSIGTFFASLNQNIYSPVIPLIRDSFGVSVNWVNFTVSSFIFITAVMQIILGTFIDSKNQKRLLMASAPSANIVWKITDWLGWWGGEEPLRSLQEIGAAPPSCPRLAEKQDQSCLKGH